MAGIDETMAVEQDQETYAHDGAARADEIFEGYVETIITCMQCEGTGGVGWIGDAHSGMPAEPCSACWPKGLDGDFLSLPPTILDRIGAFDKPRQSWTFDDVEERLAALIPGYERRDHQHVMADSVRDALLTDHHLLVRAGTGTGKTFAYCSMAVTSGKRAVVSTATKALQDQLMTKDLPMLHDAIGEEKPFTYAALKGRSNYLCAAQLAAPEESLTGDVVEALQDQFDNDADFDGERHHLAIPVTDAQWRDLTITAEDCAGKECPFFDSCYAEDAKRKAAAADVVVVNHALFFADMRVREVTFGKANMLGEYDVFIGDEAHEIVDWATDALGEQISFWSVRNLVGRVQKRIPEAISEADALGVANSTFWDDLPTETTRLTGKAILDMEAEWKTILPPLQDLCAALHALRLTEAQNKIRRQADNLLGAFTKVLSADFGDWVRWVEVTKDRRNRDRKVLRLAPINVGRILAERLWPHTQFVGTSATLEKDFTIQSLGMPGPKYVDVGTPFDYQTQARLYVPEHLPSPKNTNDWRAKVGGEIEALVTAAGGRALVLATSMRQMREYATHLRDTVPWTVYCQGEDTNPVLFERFMADERSILVATRGMFTGIDARGVACSLVIIDKLPFDVPNDPIIEARTEDIERRGGNPFMSFSIPRMTLVLEQGMGRLIRHTTDHGVVAVLDNRLFTGWGSKIVKGLPDAPLIKTIEEVNDFYDAIGLER